MVFDNNAGTVINIYEKEKSVKKTKFEMVTYDKFTFGVKQL